jgi:hypothetical protein
MLPPPTPEVLAPLQRGKVSLRGVTDEDNVSTMPTIATIRPTSRHMRLAPKADAAISTRTPLNPDFRAVVHKLSAG